MHRRSRPVVRHAQGMSFKYAQGVSFDMKMDAPKVDAPSFKMPKFDMPEDGYAQVRRRSRRPLHAVQNQCVVLAIAPLSRDSLFDARSGLSPNLMPKRRHSKFEVRRARRPKMDIRSSMRRSLDAPSMPSFSAPSMPKHDGVDGVVLAAVQLHSPRAAPIRHPQGPGPRGEVQGPAH